MTLIASGSTSEPVTITNASFFPDLTISEFRDAMRVDSTVTDDRAVHALQAAMFNVNAQLASWMADQKEAGVNTLENVPEQDWQPAGVYMRLYLRAVWSMARANLVERYRDYDSTNDGHDRAEALENTGDDYRRDAHWAIADIKGINRTTVELI